MVPFDPQCVGLQTTSDEQMYFHSLGERCHDLLTLPPSHLELLLDRLQSLHSSFPHEATFKDYSDLRPSLPIRMAVHDLTLRLTDLLRLVPPDRFLPSVMTLVVGKFIAGGLPAELFSRAQSCYDYLSVSGFNLSLSLSRPLSLPLSLSLSFAFSFSLSLCFLHILL